MQKQIKELEGQLDKRKSNSGKSSDKKSIEKYLDKIDLFE